MQIVINIPNEIYELCVDDAYFIFNETDIIRKAIKNGIPLDDIKTEILALNDDYCSTQEVLDIIENIGKGDSE